MNETDPSNFTYIAIVWPRPYKNKSWTCDMTYLQYQCTYNPGKNDIAHTGAGAHNAHPIVSQRRCSFSKVAVPPDLIIAHRQGKHGKRPRLAQHWDARLAAAQETKRPLQIPEESSSSNHVLMVASCCVTLELKDCLSKSQPWQVSTGPARASSVLPVC